MVTADRRLGILGTQTAMVDRVSSEDLNRQPVQHLTEGLQSIPGVVVLHAGAMDDQPRLIMRGFYGGGETEYAAVLLDGVPLGALGSGVVNWDVIPLPAVREIEVVRGSSSALYGDAAVGGVINILTISGAPTPLRWRIAGGAYGTVDGSAAWSGALRKRAASLFGGRRHTDGYREHEAGDTRTLGGSIDLHRSAGSYLSVSGLYHGDDGDDPGPLSGAVLASSPRASSPFFRFDHRASNLGRMTLNGWNDIGKVSRFSGYLSGESVTANTTRTLQLSPEFADTKTRATRERRLLGSMQFETESLPMAWPQSFSLGMDLSLGHLGSDYRPVLMGGVAEYASPPQPGEVDVSGRGTRTAGGLFAHWEHRIATPLRFVMAARFDEVRDAYRATLPALLARTTVTHRAFSPKLGLNVSYLNTPRHVGNIYVSTSRSFKAPTLDQLFDQRPIPIPVPPYSVTVSNPELRPQHGTAVEAGLNHRALAAAGLTLQTTLAVYRQEMRDELDFDLEQFRYINVGRSLHRGLEIGARLESETGRGSNAFVTLTRQSVLAKNGANAGRQLKAVPRQVITSGVAARLPARLQAGLTISDIRGAFLDDANARRLPGYTRVDTRLESTGQTIRFSVDVLNIFNRSLVSTGFPDPSGTDVVYYHPAAGRVVLFGVMSAW
jgi:iron complex outermembrane receptor protein